MKKPSDSGKRQPELWEKLIGLGEHSARKSYYPELQQRLEELEKFRALLDNSNDLIFMLEIPSGKIIDVNESVCRRTGFSRRKLLDLAFFDCIDRKCAQGLEQLFCLSNEDSPKLKLLEGTLNTCDGDSFPMEVTLSRMIFDDGDYVSAIVRDVTARQRKEQELLYREAFESLIAGISTRFVELAPSETDQGINLALRELGEFAGVDRSYVFLFSVDGMHMDNTHEWCAEGIIPQKENLQGIAIIDLPWTMGKTLNRQVLYVPSLAGLPLEAETDKDHWEVQDIKSLITVPILSEGEVIGFIGFDAVRTEKNWRKKDIVLLQTVGDILSNAIFRQRAEQALQKALTKAEEARDKIETILKSVADGLIFTDMENRIILLSASAEALLCRKSSEIVLKPLDEAILDQNLREHIRAIKANNKNEAILEFEQSVENKEQKRILQAKSSLVRGKNGVESGVITLLCDVSRERELDRIKNEFISTAAHELRTPLTSVRGYSQLLLADKDLAGGQHREFLAIIDEKTKELERIIDDLLDLSRVASGRIIHVKKEWHDLGVVLADLVGQYRKICKTHHFEVILPEKPVELLLDKGKIVQVMENLLSNSVKFSPGGSRIHVICEASKTEVRISVRDEGIGMTPKQVERVFEKFYRVDASDTAVGGLGIGMAIVKNIIEAHAGNIWVQSGLHRGTTVSFTLPLGGEIGNDN